MGLFKKRKPETNPITAGLPTSADELSASLKAFSGFVKRVACRNCGAPTTADAAR